MKENEADEKLKCCVPVDCAEACWSSNDVKCRKYELTVQQYNKFGELVVQHDPFSDWHVSCGDGKDVPQKYGSGSVQFKPASLQVGSEFTIQEDDGFGRMTKIKVIDEPKVACFCCDQKTFR